MLSNYVVLNTDDYNTTLKLSQKEPYQSKFLPMDVGDIASFNISVLFNDVFMNTVDSKNTMRLSQKGDI